MEKKKTQKPLEPIPLSATLLGYGLHFFTCLSLAMIEALSFLFTKTVCLSPSYISFSFAYVGLVLVFTQGFFLRKIMPLWGREKPFLWD